MVYRLDEEFVAGSKWQRSRQAACVLVGALLTLMNAAARAQDSWPQIAIPEGVTPFRMGDEMRANGLPLRLRGIVSAKSPAQVAALFRASLGQPLVENTLASRLALGRGQGEFYITVQLEAAGTGTRGLIAVSNLAAAIAQRGASARAEQRFLSRLPAGSRLLSQTGSIDGTKSADHQVFMNTRSTEFNTEHVKHMLGAEGFSFEREIPATGSTNGNHASDSRSGTSLLFKRSSGEAIAVIYRNGDGHTTVVLNTITYTERIQ